MALGCTPDSAMSVVGGVLHRHGLREGAWDVRGFQPGGGMRRPSSVAAHVIPGAGLDGKHQPLRSLWTLLTPRGQDRHQLCMDRDGARLPILQPGEAGLYHDGADVESELPAESVQLSDSHGGVQRRGHHRIKMLGG